MSDMSELDERESLGMQESNSDAGAADDAEPAQEAASAEEVFEHLARIRSGISEGVITPW